MILLKTILYLFGLLLILLDIVLLMVIIYFINYKQQTVIFKVEDPEEDYFEIAKEIIRKEKEKDDKKGT